MRAVGSTATLRRYVDGASKFPKSASGKTATITGAGETHFPEGYPYRVSYEDGMANNNVPARECELID